MNSDIEYVVNELEESLQALALVDGAEGRTLGNWYENWDEAFNRADALGAKNMIKIWSKQHGFETVTAPAVISTRRVAIYEYLSEKIRELSETSRTKDLLSENISKIRNKKLQVLLSQFNNIKDGSKESAAILSRTLISMVIIELAKNRNPESNLANTEDMAPDRIIDDALKIGLLDSGQSKLLKGFKEGAKKSFDNVTHKFGDVYLADKVDIENFVSLLIALLPEIINSYE